MPLPEGITCRNVTVIAVRVRDRDRGHRERGSHRHHGHRGRDSDSRLLRLEPCPPQARAPRSHRHGVERGAFVRSQEVQ